MTDKKTGVELIAEERQRQIEVEGWTPRHDTQHDGAEMAQAAAWYTLYTTREPLCTWPWDEEWRKPSKDSVRNLVKAGALIAAEIDRLQNLEP